MDQEYTKFFKNQKATPYLNEQFLNNIQLNDQTVMEYFYSSHFFESNSINQRCKMQKIDFNLSKAQFTGIEYNLKSTSNPYIISKDLRKNAFETITISYYYCLNGIIYQSPDLQSILISNMQTISNECNDILEIINK